MDWFWRVLGGLIVLTVLRDIFHTLWHPQGFGSLARGAIRLAWRARHRVGLRRRELIGPLGMLLAVGLWAALTVLGWALVYLPSIPEGFHYESSLRPEESSGFITSLYLSLVIASTLGFGDITPAGSALRLLAPIEGWIGFVLLTAAISWILQLYPALARRRTTAMHLHTLAAHDTAALVRTGDPVVAAGILHEVTRDLAVVAVDLSQYAESYYFVENNEAMSLAANLPYALELIEAGSASESPEVRSAARGLRSCLEHVADRLTIGHLGGEGSMEDVLRAFAQDHRLPD